MDVIDIDDWKPLVVENLSQHDIVEHGSKTFEDFDRDWSSGIDDGLCDEQRRLIKITSW